MFILFVLIYILCCPDKYILTDGLSRHELLQLGQLHCDIDDFCDKGYHLSCCATCNCMEDCLKTRTCCPNAFATKNSTNEVLTTCEDGYIRNNYFVNRTKSLEGLPAFYYGMVAHCSDGRICEFPDNSSAHSHDEHVMVYDVKMKVLYRNRNCAECNGILEYTSWRVILVECNGEELINTQANVGEILQYAWDNCAMVSVPLNNEDIELYLCHRPNYIDTCNVTGLWEVFDAEIKAECLNPNTVFPYSTKESFLYKNVYCFLCNNPTAADIERCMRGGNRNQFYVDFSELAYVRMSSVSSESSRQNIDSICQEHEVYDMFKNVCRKVHCSNGQVASNGLCIPSPLGINSYKKTIKFNIGLRPIINQILVQGTMSFGPLANLSQLLESELDIPFCEIYFADNIMVYLDKTSKNIVYISTYCIFVKEHDCLYKNIFDSVSKVIKAKTIVQLLIDETPYEFFLEFAQLFDSYNHTNISMGDQSPEYTHHLHFVTSELRPQLCPYVLMNKSDYCEIVQIYFTQHEQETLENDTCPLLFDTIVFSEYLVCVDTFEKILRIPGQDKMSIKGLLSLIMTCFSVFCIFISFVIYLLLNRLKRAPMYIFTSALVNLTVAQCVFQFGSNWTDYKGVCEAMGAALHYFWLAAMFALNAYCVVVLTSLQVLQSIVNVKKTILVSFMYIYGLPLCFIIANIVYSTVGDANGEFNSGYGHVLCHIDSDLMRGILFSLPIFLTVIINLFVSSSTIYKIRKTTSAIHQNRKYKSFGIVYFRLLLASGTSWMIGFINQFLNIRVLDFLFIILVAGQGVFLLMSILISSSIRKPIRHSLTNIFTKSTYDSKGNLFRT